MFKKLRLPLDDMQQSGTKDVVAASEDNTANADKCTTADRSYDHVDKAPELKGSHNAGDEWFANAPAAWSKNTQLRLACAQRSITSGQLFKFMDLNRDDLISYDEFKKGLAMSGIRPVPSEEVCSSTRCSSEALTMGPAHLQEMKLIFESFDNDGDGAISYKEMVQQICSFNDVSILDLRRPCGRYPRWRTSTAVWP